MEILVTLLLALLVGFVAYLITKEIDYTSRYARAIGLIVAVLVFLARLGYGL